MDDDNSDWRIPGNASPGRRHDADTIHRPGVATWDSVRETRRRRLIPPPSRCDAPRQAPKRITETSDQARCSNADLYVDV